MSLRVEWTTKARRAFERIADANPDLAERLRNAVAHLPHTYRTDPQLRQPFSGYRRHRVGDYRIIYEIIQQRLVVLIINIGHRREIYDR